MTGPATPFVQFLNYLTFAAAVLFFSALVRGVKDHLIIHGETYDQVNLDYLGLTASSMAYAICFWMCFLKQGNPFSFYMLHITWIPAILMVAFYFRGVRGFLSDPSRFPLWISRMLFVLAGLVALVTLHALLTGKSLFYAPVPFETRNDLWRAVGGNLGTPLPLIQLVGIVSILGPIPGYAHFARFMYRNRRHEPLLYFGIALALLSTANEVLASFGVINTISIFFLSKGFEIARIGRHYHRKAMSKIRDLEAELGEVSKQALSAFITGGLVHDINNLLSVILTSVSALKMRGASGEAALAFAEEVSKSALRIRDASQSYLKVFKKSQASDQEKQLVAVSALVEGGLALAQPRLIQARVEDVRKRIVTDASVRVNATQLELVLANLINNASDAIRKQDARWIELEADLSGERHVRIRVIDSGKMDPAVRDRLFREAFTTKSEGGNGIGLRIAQKLTQLHAGSLACVPHPEGTCFEILLPRA